ncbi:hypothetical protein EJ04DRAFT_604930 [Polyplosphaeria fusca]|uniref:RanBP2-type domain-containing protein n=1 Tax=Polyplosphaeria fusca TaxID=682080 RepID=A0A9P4UZ39_9PLEO|nr:hypothetical protein EJ04DRAFT_604930 [Polyplosphaeria fusca]
MSDAFHPFEMAHTDGPGEIPSDMWICHECHGGNLISIAKDQCPVCSHDRCGLCPGPDEPLPDWASIRADQDHPEQFMENTGVIEPHGAYYEQAHHSHAYGLNPHQASSSPSDPNHSDDMWVCPNSDCNTENASWLSFCPICGTERG